MLRFNIMLEKPSIYGATFNNDAISISGVLSLYPPSVPERFTCTEITLHGFNLAHG